MQTFKLTLTKDNVEIESWVISHSSTMSAEDYRQNMGMALTKDIFVCEESSVALGLEGNVSLALEKYLSELERKKYAHTP